MNFKRLNNIVGWAVFVIAMYTYMATLEPTVSLWDCGEYISTAYKLEVGHPPGAPLFNMLGRIASAFVAPGQVAYMVNLLSALCSAFTILFMYWSITYLVRKIASRGGKELSKGDLIAVLGSGAMGALAYAFSDSFWFSAVEGEVYAMSSFFTALVVWATFKWEEVADEPGADRWLIFIFFMIGLSIGVHLLNLLAIPAIVYVYYFRRHEKTTTKGFLLAGLVGMLVLGFLQGILIPGMVSYPAFLEKMFVNSMGLPFSSGAVFFYALILALIVFGIYYTHKKGKAFLNTIILCFTVLTIGYSCFFMILIRSNANTPIDENNPENQIAMLSYLLREQYGSWPIVYGPYWNSAPDLEHEDGYLIDGTPIYMRGFAVERDGEFIQGFRTQPEADQYVKEKKLGGVTVTEKYFVGDDRKNVDLRYKPEHMTVFPRMFSRDPRHVRGYQLWSGYDPNDAGETFMNPFTGQMESLPTFGNNMKYFFDYQLGWMYWRYFMWNFVGRQNDEQAVTHQPLEGNWLSGVNFIDKEHIGDQTKLPSSMKMNRAYNRFFFLPLIFGLLGMFYHLWKAPKDWFVVLLLFLFAGIMIIIYLNSKPFEPRERDYAYAGSFYAFAFWIGFGVYALYDAVKSLTMKALAKPAAILGGLILLRYLIETGSENGHVLSYSLLFMGIICFGLLALMIYLGKSLKNEQTLALLAVLLVLPAPAIMAYEGWDDHDRSRRATALEFARNYLESCETNAIIFTHGDNDTFPLWYAQEVEGIRTDVRIVNLSLLGTDWYIDQMLRKAYKSDPVPFSAPEYMYRQGGLLDYVELDADKSGKPMDLKDAMAFVMNDANARLKQDGSKAAYIPNRTFTYPVDRSLVEKYKVLPEDRMKESTNMIKFTVPKGSVYKNDLMILDLIANNDWKRPVYFAGAADAKTYLGLQDYFSMEGLVYKFVPVYAPGGNVNVGFGKVDVDRMYDNLMNKYKWGGLDKKNINVDYYVRRTMTNNYRLMFLNLGQHLGADAKTADARIKMIERNLKQFEDSLAAGRIPASQAAEVRSQLDIMKTELPGLKKRRDEGNEKLKKLMRRCFEVMPEENVPFDRIVPSMVPLVLQSGDKELGAKLVGRMIKLESENLDYYTSLNPRFASGVAESASISYRILRLMEESVNEYGLTEYQDQIKAKKLQAETRIQQWLGAIREYDVEHDTQMYPEVFQAFGFQPGAQQQ